MILAGVTVNLLIAYILFFIVIVGNGEFKPSTSIDRVQSEQPGGGRRAEGRRQDRRDQRQADQELGRRSARTCGRTRASRSRSPCMRNGQRDRRSPRRPRRVAGEGKLGVLPERACARPTRRSRRCRSRSTWMGRADRGDRRRPRQDRSRRPASSSTARPSPNPDAKGSFSNEERPRSIVGIVADGGSIVGGSVWVLLVLLATINLFLALFNLIPLLPFDGGHAAVAIYESIASKVKGRKVQVDYKQADADHRGGAGGRARPRPLDDVPGRPPDHHRLTTSPGAGVARSDGLG